MLALASAPALADVPERPADRPLDTGRLSTLDVRLDNDSFATWPHDDGWYTAGLAASWLVEAAADDGPHARVARLACAWTGCGGGARVFRLGTLTHRIMTPLDTRRATPQPDDRPYAATLALGTGVVVREPAVQHRLELRLGVVGPAALGESAQNGVHRALGLDRALGWDTQLRARPLVQLGASRIVRHGDAGAPLDWVHRVAVDVGTLQARAAVGAMLRVGALPAGPDWPGEPAATWTDGDGGAWHLYAGGVLRAVGWDRTIDGPAYGYRPRTEPEPIGGELFAGAAVRVAREWRLELTMTLRAVEFDSPNPSAERAQRFATLSVHWAGR